MAELNGRGFPRVFYINEAGKTIYLLLNSHGSSQTTFLIVYSITRVGFNNPHISLIVYSSTDYTGNSITNIVPLDGKTYNIVQVEHEGVVYEAIEINIGGTDKGAMLYAYGSTTLNNKNLFI